MKARVMATLVDAVTAHELEDVLHAGLVDNGNHRLGLVGGERPQSRALTARHHDGLHNANSRSGWTFGACFQGRVKLAVSADAVAEVESGREQGAGDAHVQERVRHGARPEDQGNAHGAHGEPDGRAAGPVDRDVEPQPQPDGNRHDHHGLARDQHRDGPARKQLEVPADSAPAMTTNRSISGSIRAPSRLYWPVDAGQHPVERSRPRWRCRSTLCWRSRGRPPTRKPPRRT